MNCIICGEKITYIKEISPYKYDNGLVDGSIDDIGKQAMFKSEHVKYTITKKDTYAICDVCSTTFYTKTGKLIRYKNQILLPIQRL